MGQYGNHCVHHSGLEMFRSGQCKANVELNQFNNGQREGLYKKIPCNKTNNCTETCSKQLFPTEEEIVEHEKEWQEVLDRILKLNPLIARLKQENPNGGNGIEECETCGKNLHWGIAQCNGHIHLKCETDGCVFMME